MRPLDAGAPCGAVCVGAVVVCYHPTFAGWGCARRAAAGRVTVAGSVLCVRGVVQWRVCIYYMFRYGIRRTDNIQA